MKPRQKVSIVKNLDELVNEMAPAQPVCMVRPRFARQRNDQRMTTTAEIVDLSRINLAKITTFETC